MINNWKPRCDHAAELCDNPVEFVCNCRRCGDEPREERFYCCLAHFHSVDMNHRRVRGYPGEFVKLREHRRRLLRLEETPMPDETPEQKARRLGVPLVPKRAPTPPSRTTVAVCGECGREISANDLYACPRADCPLQTRAWSWST